MDCIHNKVTEARPDANIADNDVTIANVDSSKVVISTTTLLIMKGCDP
jgi:hypothetical protein